VVFNRGKDVSVRERNVASSNHSHTVQWRSKGASGGTRPGAQALGAHQHAFCSHLKRVLSRNLGQSML